MLPSIPSLCPLHERPSNSSVEVVLPITAITVANAGLYLSNYITVLIS